MAFICRAGEKPDVVSNQPALEKNSKVEKLIEISHDLERVRKQALQIMDKVDKKLPLLQMMSLGASSHHNSEAKLMLDCQLLPEAIAMKEKALSELGKQIGQACSETSAHLETLTKIANADITQLNIILKGNVSSLSSNTDINMLRRNARMKVANQAVKSLHTLYDLLLTLVNTLQMNLKRHDRNAFIAADMPEFEDEKKRIAGGNDDQKRK